jgi:hypothetical protein
MPKDNFPIEHNVLVELFGPDGELKQREEIHNLVPTVGKEAVAKLLKEGTTRPTHLAIGEGTKAAEAADTKLQTETKRKAATIGVSGAVFTAEAEFGKGEGTGSVTEEGLFSASSEGTIFARSVFGVITKGAEDTLKITHTITVG